jgi:hypothetical protein
MISKIKNLVLFVLCFAITGCVTYKADSSGLSSPDYNQRIRVTDPHYDGVLNPIGVTSMAAATIGAGYFAYNSNLIKINDGSNQTTSQIGNAVIGAAVGFGASYLVNRWFGWGKTKPVYSYNYQEWVKKANKNFVLLPDNDYLTVMPKSTEPSYKILDKKDMKEFSETFKNSVYADSVVHRAIPQLNRDELLQLINTFPDVSTIKEAKIQYILQSKTLENIFASKELFKDVELNIEKPASELIYSLSDAKLFFKYYSKSSYSNVIESKSAKLISSIDDCSSFKFLFPFSTFAPSIIKKLTNTLKRVDLPVLVNLYFEIPEIEQTKIQYIKTSNTAADFFEAISKYPIKSVIIEKSNYSENINECKKTIDDIEEKSEILGSNNVSRLTENVKNEYLANLLNHSNTKSEYYSFIDCIRNNSWLQPQSNKYLYEANKYIAKITENENNQARIVEFNIAKNNGVGAILSFANKYPGTNEAQQAKSLLDNYVKQNVIRSMEPFYWAAQGDKSFWGAWAENNRSWWQGSKQYNIFVAGRLKNTLNETLKLKITTKLNLIKTTRVLVFSSSNTQTLTQEFFMELYPKKEQPFISLFDNISGGFQVGGIIGFGSSVKIDESNPFEIEFEYYDNNIPQNTIDLQNNLIKNVIKNRGNVDVKVFGGRSINEITAGSLWSDSNSSTLLITYKTKSNYSSLNIYNSDGEQIKTDSWSSSGTNNGTYILPQGTYTIKASDCENKYEVNLNVRKMTLIIEKNCSSNEVKEND